MDHHDRDLVRLVRADEQQVGPLESMFGSDQASPAVSIQIRPRPHVSQGSREVGLEWDEVRFLADGPVAHGIVQVQRTNPGLANINIRVAATENWLKERCQRESHLGRIESLLGLAVGPSLSRSPELRSRALPDRY